MTFRFLDLPAEMRDLVYGQVLHPAANRRKNRDGYAKYHFNLALLRTSRQVSREARRVLYALNQFACVETPWPQAQEAVERDGFVPILLRNVNVNVDNVGGVDDNDDNKKPEQPDPSPYARCNFAMHSLVVRIDAPGYTDNVPPDNYHRMAVHADDLPAFAEFWMYQDLTHRDLNPHMRLTLTLRNPATAALKAGPDRGKTGEGKGGDESKMGEEEGGAEGGGEGGTESGAEGGKSKEEGKTEDAALLPRAVQRRLLEPFGVLRHLHGLVVRGGADDDLEQALRAEQAKPYRSPEDCLDEAAARKEAGNALLGRGEFRAAIRAYEDSFRSLHIVCDGRRRSVFGEAHFVGEMRSGRFRGELGTRRRLILRVQLVANIVHAYLRLNDYAWAKFWGKRTIRLFRGEIEVDGALDGEPDEEPILDFPASAEMGKIYYRTGVAYKKLGKPDKARALLKVAMAYLPHDPQVKQEHASVALQIG